MVNFLSRAFNNIEVDEVQGTITKVSASTKMKNEIFYYRRIQSHPHLARRFPRVIGSKEGNPNTLILEYVGYDNLGVWLTDNHRISSTEPTYPDSVFKSLKVIINDFQTKWGTYVNRDDVQWMYIEKTQNEYHDLVKMLGQNDPLFASGVIYLNGTKLKNFNIIWDEVKSYILDNMMICESTVIHGDLCFSNILYTNHDGNNLFKFIDPRGSFGARGMDSVGIWGDPRYDIAKLYHSVDGGYEFIINDYFTLKGDLDTNNYVLWFESPHEPYSSPHQYTRYDDTIKCRFEDIFFDEYSKKEIKLIQGLIFVGMCSRHYDSEPRQRAMYLTGIRLLNEAMEL